MQNFPPQYIPVEHSALARPAEVPVIFPAPLQKELLSSEKCPGADIRAVFLALASAGLEVVGQNDPQIFSVVVKSVDGKGIIRGNVGLDDGLDRGVVVDPETLITQTMSWRKPKSDEDPELINRIRRMYGLPPREEVLALLEP